MSNPGYAAVLTKEESLTVVIDGKTHTVECHGPQHLTFLRAVSAVKNEVPVDQLKRLLEID